MSAPFVNEIFEFAQPDGTTIAVRGTGNQLRAQFETLEGRPLIRNADGQFVEAPALAARRALAGATTQQHQMESSLVKRKSRWESRRRELGKKGGPALAARISRAPPARQTVGNIVGLTLLVDFSDAPATIPAAEVTAFCNQPGYSGFGNNGSVHDYFRDVSGGKLTYTNVVAPYYRAKKPKSYYTDRNQPFTKRAQELIREALRHHIAKGFNFNPLTADGKGFIYALNVFYAGPVVNAWSEGLWPHQSTLAPKFQLSSVRRFADYQITNMGSELTLGTFCHENGHMVCDFPDLYEYTRPGLGVGAFCLMCYGANGANAKNPVHVGAYLKNEAGWGAASAAVAGATVSLTAGTNQFVTFSQNASEYFIIENRQRSGRDAGLPGSGLAIWHIDERASNTRPVSHYECSLVQADARRDLENGANFGEPGDLFFLGNKTEFSASTSPNSNWFNGGSSGLAIQQISASGVSMTFKVA